MQAFQYEKAKKSWPLVNEVSKGGIFLGGILELLGAIIRIRHNEYKEIGVNIVFLALAVLVVIGRM